MSGARPETHLAGGRRVAEQLSCWLRWLITELRSRGTPLWLTVTRQSDRLRSASIEDVRRLAADLPPLVRTWSGHAQVTFGRVRQAALARAARAIPPPFSSASGTTSPIRAHYEVARYTLLVLWRGRWLIARLMAACVVLAAAVLAVLPARYTSEALIQLNFTREEPANGSRRLVVATLDGPSLIDSGVRLLRSRATASAVVNRLGLAEDRTFARQSSISTVLYWLGTILGQGPRWPSRHDLAVETLMKNVRVENQSRSNLISITVSSPDPEKSRLLANAVALEYLRASAMRDLAQQQLSAESELSGLLAQLGARHPTVQRAQLRVEQVRAELDRLRDAPALTGVVALSGDGPTLIPADNVSVPSGPNAKLILIMAWVIGLGAGVFVVLYRERFRDREEAADPLAGVCGQVREDALDTP